MLPIAARSGSLVRELHPGNCQTLLAVRSSLGSRRASADDGHTMRRNWCLTLGNGMKA